MNKKRGGRKGSQGWNRSRVRRVRVRDVNSEGGGGGRCPPGRLSIMRDEERAHRIEPLADGR